MKFHVKGQLDDLNGDIDAHRLGSPQLYQWTWNMKWICMATASRAHHNRKLVTWRNNSPAFSYSPRRAKTTLMLYCRITFAVWVVEGYQAAIDKQFIFIYLFTNTFSKPLQESFLPLLYYKKTGDTGGCVWHTFLYCRIRRRWFPKRKLGNTNKLGLEGSPALCWDGESSSEGGPFVKWETLSGCRWGRASPMRFSSTSDSAAYKCPKNLSQQESGQNCTCIVPQWRTIKFTDR